MMIIIRIMIMIRMMMMTSTKNLYLALFSEGGKVRVVFRCQTYWCLNITVMRMTMMIIMMTMMMAMMIMVMRIMRMVMKDADVGIHRLFIATD